MFFSDIRARFHEFGRISVESGLVKEFTLREDDGLHLTMTRAADRRRVQLQMTGTGEVFILKLDGVYAIDDLAYDAEERAEKAEDLLRVADLYLRRSYFEEVCKRHDRIVARTITFTGPGAPPPIVATSLVDRILNSILGCDKSVVRP